MNLAHGPCTTSYEFWLVTAHPSTEISLEFSDPAWRHCAQWSKVWHHTLDSISHLVCDNDPNLLGIAVLYAGSSPLAYCTAVLQNFGDKPTHRHTNKRKTKQEKKTLSNKQPNTILRTQIGMGFIKQENKVSRKCHVVWKMLCATQYWLIEAFQGQEWVFEGNTVLQGHTHTKLQTRSMALSQWPQPFKVARNGTFRENPRGLQHHGTHYLMISSDSEGALEQPLKVWLKLKPFLLSYK